MVHFASTGLLPGYTTPFFIRVIWEISCISSLNQLEQQPNVLYVLYIDGMLRKHYGAPRISSCLIRTIKMCRCVRARPPYPESVFTQCLVLTSCAYILLHGVNHVYCIVDKHHSIRISAWMCRSRLHTQPDFGSVTLGLHESGCKFALSPPTTMVRTRKFAPWFTQTWSRRSQVCSQPTKLTYDDVRDLYADRRLDVLHDVEHRLVAAVPQVEVDVAGEQDLYHVHLKHA